MYLIGDLNFEVTVFPGCQYMRLDCIFVLVMLDWLLLHSAGQSSLVETNIVLTLHL